MTIFNYVPSHSSVEAQFEARSYRRVLKNLLGIRRKREMNRMGAQEQLRALHELIKIYGKSHRFTRGSVIDYLNGIAGRVAAPGS